MGQKRPKKRVVAATSIFGVIFDPKTLGSRHLFDPKNTLFLGILPACYQDFLKKGRLAQSKKYPPKNEHKKVPPTKRNPKKGLL